MFLRTSINARKFSIDSDIWTAWFATHATQDAVKKLSKSIRGKKKGGTETDPDEVQNGWNALKSIVGGMR